MTIIEAMKEIKNLKRKCNDLRTKVRKHSAHLNVEGRTGETEYDDPEKMVDKWVNQHHDYLKRILELRARIQKTNINTDVTVEVGGKKITRTISEWIYRRRDLADLDAAMQKSLTDRGLQEGKLDQGRGTDREPLDIEIVRNYDPEQRDKKIEEYSSEPLLIDSRLEVINATTELLEI